MRRVSALALPLSLAFVLPTACGGDDSSSGTADPVGAGTGGKAGRPGPAEEVPIRACSSEADRTGEATFYDFADGSGNCMFDASPDDLRVAAMNHDDYLESGVCGACAHLVGPSGEVTVRIVDQCPDCPKGNIDLSPSAFDEIAKRELGRVPITWQYVECGVSGPLRYRFKEGSNQWWTAVQVRNHRYAIAKLEVKKNGAFVAVARENYNYFVDGGGMGPGPYTFRLTDVYGHTIEDTGIEHREAQEVEGEAQFPVCDE
jgi:expansin (peptidoglycan-binding protein)